MAIHSLKTPLLSILLLLLRVRPIPFPPTGASRQGPQGQRQLRRVDRQRPTAEPFIRQRLRGTRAPRRVELEQAREEGEAAWRDAGKREGRRQGRGVGEGHLLEVRQLLHALMMLVDGEWRQD